MKIPNLKNNFGAQILERGEDYYKEGRVKNIILDGNIVKATVIGNKNYKVRIDLPNEIFRCTCPCDFNCKHAAAALYKLRENKNIQTTEGIKNELNKKSKGELVEILQKILVSEPRFNRLLWKQDIKKSINELDIENEEDIDNFIEEVDDIYESIIKNKERLNNLILLFNKCFKIYDKLGGIEELEDTMFNMLEQISKEARKLDKEKRQKIIQKLIDLTKEFGFFHDSIEDRGLKISYDYKR